MAKRKSEQARKRVSQAHQAMKNREYKVARVLYPILE